MNILNYFTIRELINLAAALDPFTLVGVELRVIAGTKLGLVVGIILDQESSDYQKLNMLWIKSH